MENALIIKGGNKLAGKVKLSGAKNVALKVIIAGLMFEKPVIIKNVPHIKDVEELFHLIDLLGGEAKFIEENTVLVDGRFLNLNKVDLLHASKIRVSFLLFAPLLFKFKECYIPNPGGCRIGARPIDRVIEGFRHLGISVEYDSDSGYYQAKLTNFPKGNYRFTKPTHTGTEALILISLLTKEKVVLENSALEPEIDDLINFLKLAGAKIKRNGNIITILPSEKLYLNNPYSIINDRNELVTYACLAVATKGKILIGEINPIIIDSFLKKMKDIGVGISIKKNNLIEFCYQNNLSSTIIETSPYPGFMTDWQPNLAVLLTQASGESKIIERVFENRFAYVQQLKKLGAKIEYIDWHIKNPKDYYFFNWEEKRDYLQAIKIIGPQTLHEGVVDVTDLRAGAALVIACFLAKGESVINGAEILERGYENLVEKIKNLGGEIKKL